MITAVSGASLQKVKTALESATNRQSRYLAAVGSKKCSVGTRLLIIAECPDQRKNISPELDSMWRVSWEFIEHKKKYNRFLCRTVHGSDGPYGSGRNPSPWLWHLRLSQKRALRVTNTEISTRLLLIVLSIFKEEPVLPYQSIRRILGADVTSGLVSAFVTILRLCD